MLSSAAAVGALAETALQAFRAEWAHAARDQGPAGSETQPGPDAHADALTSWRAQLESLCL